MPRSNSLSEGELLKKIRMIYRCLAFFALQCSLLPIVLLQKKTPNSRYFYEKGVVTLLSLIIVSEKSNDYLYFYLIIFSDYSSPFSV